VLSTSNRPAKDGLELAVHTFIDIACGIQSCSLIEFSLQQAYLDQSLSLSQEYVLVINAIFVVKFNWHQSYF